MRRQRFPLVRHMERTVGRDPPAVPSIRSALLQQRLATGHQDLIRGLPLSASVRLRRLQPPAQARLNVVDAEWVHQVVTAQVGRQQGCLRTVSPLGAAECQSAEDRQNTACVPCFIPNSFSRSREPNGTESPFARFCSPRQKNGRQKHGAVTVVCQNACQAASSSSPSHTPRSPAWCTDRDTPLIYSDRRKSRNRIVSERQSFSLPCSQSIQMYSMPIQPAYPCLRISSTTRR